MSKKKTKKKKPKVIYIDDGSTIADMSGVSGGLRRNRDPRHSLSEQRKTFLAAMRMMVRPMLFVMGAITLAYLIAYLLLFFDLFLQWRACCDIMKEKTAMVRCL